MQGLINGDGVTPPRQFARADESRGSRADDGNGGHDDSSGLLRGTGRPAVVTYKDIPQDAASMVEWHARYQDVFGYRTEGRALFAGVRIGSP